MAESKKGKKPGVAATKKAEAPAKKAPAAPKPSLIDTSLAAAAAAKMVAHGPAPVPSASDHSESAAFKRLKDGLNKPAGGGVASFIQSTSQIKKGGQPFGAQNQMKRGQTFGADVNRSGVPRRTGG